MGIGITVRSIEIVGDRVYVQATLSMIVEGAIQIQRLHGETLYFRHASQPRPAVSRLKVFGPNPTTVIISTGLGSKKDDVFELGIDHETPLVSLCLVTDST